MSLSHLLLGHGGHKTGPGAVILSRDLLSTLRIRDIEAAARTLEVNTGLKHIPTSDPLGWAEDRPRMYERIRRRSVTCGRPYL
jgi:hypothetical protein